MIAPGPDDAQLRAILEAAIRVPDHGKLNPWRFLIIAAGDKPELVERLRPLAADQPDPDKARAVLAKLANPPLTVTVVSRTVPSLKVPAWEQELSAGAVCMNLLHAADLMGFSANWITDWYAFDPRALAILGLAADETIAGFVHVGTAPEPPLERVRPDVQALTSRWTVA